MPKAVHEPRQDQDKFYWYVNDILDAAYEYGYAIPGPYQGPSTYEMLKTYDPDLTLMEWFEWVSRYLIIREKKKNSDGNEMKEEHGIEVDWRTYLHSLEPEKTLKEVTDLQHIRDNILREDTEEHGISVTENVRTRWARGIRLGIREVLPRQKPRTRKEYLEWITYDAAALILNVQKDYFTKLIRRGKVIGHPDRRLLDRDSVFDYREGKQKQKK